MNKLQAICKYLDTDYSEDIDNCPVNDMGNNVFEYLNEKYFVLTDQEADETCKKYIIDSLWAFNPEFIVPYMGCFQDLDVGVDCIKTLQEKCEDCNEALLSMVGNNINSLIENAIQSDGRGHFLNTYDGEEFYNGEYFIYRIN